MYFVYILTNDTHTVLYTGVTKNLIRRTYEHQQKFVDGFTTRYHLKHLIYYEPFENILAAIQREKQIKAWKRKWKERLICNFNPRWRDLYEELGPSLE